MVFFQLYKPTRRQNLNMFGGMPGKGLNILKFPVPQKISEYDLKCPSM